MLKFSSLDCFVNKLSVLVNVHRYQVQQTEIVCYDYCDASYVVKLVELSFFFFLFCTEISMDVLWKEHWHQSLEILLT